MQGLQSAIVGSASDEKGLRSGCYQTSRCSRAADLTSLRCLPQVHSGASCFAFPSSYANVRRCITNVGNRALGPNHLLSGPLTLSLLTARQIVSLVQCTSTMMTMQKRKFMLIYPREVTTSIRIVVRDWRSESWEEQAEGVIRRPDKPLETSPFGLRRVGRNVEGCRKRYLKQGAWPCLFF